MSVFQDTLHSVPLIKYLPTHSPAVLVRGKSQLVHCSLIRAEQQGQDMGRNGDLVLTKGQMARFQKCLAFKKNAGWPFLLLGGKVARWTRSIALFCFFCHLYCIGLHHIFDTHWSVPGSYCCTCPLECIKADEQAWVFIFLICIFCYHGKLGGKLAAICKMCKI